MMGKVKKRPGVMIYFDLLPAIEHLSREERGDLLMAIMQYASNGTDFEFTGALAVAWAMIRPKIDRDEERYDNVVIDRQYGPYCREARKRGDTPIDAEQWRQLTEHERKQMISGDIIRCPTADAPAKTTTYTATSAYTSSSVTDDQHLHAMRDTGTIQLSRWQYDSLLEAIGPDRLQNYIRRLDHYLQNHGPTEQDHYLEILAWWAEECAGK